MTSARTLDGDWFPGTIPENVDVDETAYIESSFSFQIFRSTREAGVSFGRGASVYMGTMFDVGARGRVTLGRYTLVNSARVICDDEISIGDYALLSWNVLLMDTYRLPLEPQERRWELERLPTRAPRIPAGDVLAKPVRIERNVWIGFDCCVLPGVTIGAGSIIGARSVVSQDIPAYTIAAGNPAQVIRHLDPQVREVRAGGFQLDRTPV